MINDYDDNNNGERKYDSHNNDNGIASIYINKPTTTTVIFKSSQK